MPLRFPTETFFTNSGNAAAQFQEAVRDGIADFACGLWANFPGFITNNKSPANSFARGYMNSMCQNRVTLPTPPASPFTGGQCPTNYYLTLCVECDQYQITSTSNPGNFQNKLYASLDTQGQFIVQGPIESVTFSVRGDCPKISGGPVVCTFGRQEVWTTIVGANGTFEARMDLKVEGCFGATNRELGGSSYVLRDSLVPVQIVPRTVSGAPDNCGDPDATYDSPSPTTIDLSTTLVINSQDGNDLNLNLTYNQLSPEFNFPLGFKFEGINVTLDFSGITIYGDESYTTPNNNNDPVPPGSDGGDNGIDPPYVVTYPDQPYLVLPDFSLPKVVEETFATAVCTDGVISIVNEVVGSLPGIAPPLRVILAILVALLEEICTAEQVEAIVGFPEYYGVKPGADRPAIVYLYKTWDGTNYGASTYSATVNNPSSSAVAEIETVQIPNKTIGTFVASITLTNGTRLKASGSSKPNAIANLNFLIGKADPAILPANLTASTVVTEDTRLNVVDLVCRQIEYYPNGAGANKNPAIRRVIDQ